MQWITVDIGSDDDDNNGFKSRKKRKRRKKTPAHWCIICVNYADWLFGPLENGRSGNEICAQWCFLFHYIETEANVTCSARTHRESEEGEWVKTTQTHESASAHQKKALSAKSLWSSLICIKTLINTHNSYRLTFTNSIRPVPFGIRARPFASNNTRQLNYCCVVVSFFLFPRERIDEMRSQHEPEWDAQRH